MDLTKHNKGFSLVELILAVGIASLLMGGMSLFFSSTLKNTFEAQEKVVATQGQFVVNTIVREKLNDVSQVLNGFAGAPPEADHLLAVIKREGALPISYIGKANDQLVFKDLLMFNKIVQIGPVDNFYGDAEGKIKRADSEEIVLQGLPPNFAGFTKIKNDWFIALPDQNKIIRCAEIPINCNREDLLLDLKTPMDVETDGTDLFVSDAGNHRVIKVKLADHSITELATDLRFPTGLAYHRARNALFFSDTLKHQVKRIDLAAKSVTVSVIAGLGDPGNCGKTALYCNLNLPTGLFVEPVNQELYIADSGNHRILKIKDPGNPTELSLTFRTPARAGVIKKMVVSFPPEVNLERANLTVTSEGNFNTKGIVTALPNALVYKLFSTLLEDTFLTNSCAPPPCLKVKFLPNAIDLFNGVNAIHLDDDSRNPLTGTRAGRIVQIDPPGFGEDHTAREEVLLANPVNASTEITLALSGLETSRLSDPYSVIQITAYGLDDSALFTRYQGLRAGDEILGTPEDGIESVAWNNGGAGRIIKTDGAEKGLDTALYFPTGVSHVYVSNSGAKKLIKRNEIPLIDEVDLNSVAIPSLAAFDYTSDFKVSRLHFKKFNGEKGLQMTLEANVDDATTATYQFDAKLE